MLDPLRLTPRRHHMGIVERQHRHHIPAFTLDLIQLLDVAGQMLDGAAGCEGACECYYCTRQPALRAWVFSWEMERGSESRLGKRSGFCRVLRRNRTGHAEQNDFLGGEFLAGVVAAGGDAAGFFVVGDVAVGDYVSQ